MGKGVVATLTALLTILPTCVPVHAQDRSHTIRQFHHMTWTAKDGAPPEIWALDQGPDGFLWLGTGSGLYRFDGMTFERYRLAPGEQLASIDITAVEVLPSNEIWIGYSDGGVSRLKDGRVTTFTEKDGIGPGMIVHFRQDRDGVLWAVSHGGLSRFLNGHWRSVGADWDVPADFIVGLFIARDGVRWLSTAQGLYFARPGVQRFEPTGAVAEHATLTETPDGRIWIADRPHGLRPMPNYVGADRRSPWKERTVPSGNVLSLASFAVDRQGVIWGTDRVNGGIFRFDPRRTPQPTHSLMASDVDVFRRTDGLTAGRSIPILSDREGNIWVGTSAGLNHFHYQRDHSRCGGSSSDRLWLQHRDVARRHVHHRRGLVVSGATTRSGASSCAACCGGQYGAAQKQGWRVVVRQWRCDAPPRGQQDHSNRLACAGARSKCQRDR